MSDLTSQEEAHVRAALHFLRRRVGGWAYLAKILRSTETTLKHSANGHMAVTASLTVRVARLVKIGIDELLAGKFPEPGACPFCGRGPTGVVDSFMGIGHPQQ